MTRGLLLILIGALPFLTSCKPRPAADNRPAVTVSILPFSWFVNELAGDHFTVNVLVPPGANHHNYDPAPKQLRELERSKVLFINGHLGFEEAWIPKMRQNYPELPVISLADGIGLITSEGGEGGHEGHDHGDEVTGDHGHDHEGVDPHYWMSVKEGRILARTVAAGLISADESARGLIVGNLNRLLARLDSLDTAIAATCEPLRHRSFIVFHPALAYLARDYGLEQYSMEQAGKEPTALHFRNLVDLAANKGINTIFIQKEYDQENARTFARETGSRIVVIDPMSPDWFGEMVSLKEKLMEMDAK